MATTPEAPGLDRAQVAREADETKAMLARTAIPDQYPRRIALTSARASPARLDERALGIESYGRRIRPPLRRPIRVGTPADG